MSGFEPLWLPDFLFDFQRALTEWAIRKGRCAIFADCGLGKTLMQLVWAENVARKTNKPVLILTPLAVSFQTEREAHKFGIKAQHSRDGSFHDRIVIANYEMLHHFCPADFVGIVCDESSILKAFGGTRRKQITRFMTKMPYRLLCTATAAPNDYIELGTSSEALGELSYNEMLRRFFKYCDDKGQKKDLREQDEAEKVEQAGSIYFQKLAYRVSQTVGQWRLKHHAIEHFWRWVASWAKACRMPSDLGFSDDGFVLPDLIIKDHIIPSPPRDGMLFSLPAFGVGEEREERRLTIRERVAQVAALVDHEDQAVIWCQMNDEANALEKTIKDARQIAGNTPDDRKVDLYESFASGALRVLITKPKIGGFGLNWQHCNRMVTFPTHSYEQYYQSTKRCHRFGQKRPVRLDVVATEGEIRVLANMRKKANRADVMFRRIVKHMSEATQIKAENPYNKEMLVPSWL